MKDIPKYIHEQKLLPVAAALVVTLASCSKDKAPEPNPQQTPKERIVGQWRTEFWAWDQNHNGQLDEAEKEPWMMKTCACLPFQPTEHWP